MRRRKRKALAVWKVVLITIASIIGLMGVSVFVMYLLGMLEDTIVNPTSINFVKEGNEFYNSDRDTYEVSSNFSLTITTSTEGVTEDLVTLSLPNGTVRDGRIYNDVVSVPQTVRLNTPFEVELRESYNAELDRSYRNGGTTTISCESEYGPSENDTITISVDVPVSSIHAYVYDALDSTMTDLNGSVFIGSQFKVNVEFLPEASRYMFSTDEEKLVFYDPQNNYIDFDYETRTFDARDVSAGTGDTIRIFTFVDAYEQRQFLEANSDAQSFSVLNSRALNYFDAHQGSYAMDEIRIMVEEVSVHSFNISATNFSWYADTKFHLAFNSTSPVFSGNLGANIRDSEGNALNSIYAEGVGISYLGSDNAEGADGITLRGSNYVMEVVETGKQGTDGGWHYTYQVNRIAYDSEASYTAHLGTAEDGSVTNTYYFILPSISSSSLVDNNSYEISTENQIDNGKFISALFLETDEGYEIFFDGSLSSKTQSLQNIFPTFYMDFEVSADNDIYWTSTTSPLTLVYDTDSMLSDTYDLSQDIFVDETNIYQTVRYFFSTDTGDALGTAPLEYAGSGLYNRADLGMTSQGTSTIVLYELNNSFLRAINGYDGTLYLYFATVRTNADGEIIYGNNGLYDIVQFSSARSLVIDATISFESITPQITITSAIAVDRFLVTGTNGQANIYLPTELYTNLPENENADSFTFEISLNSEDLISQNQISDFWTLFNNSSSSDSFLNLEFRTQSGEVWNYITITDVVNDTTDGVVIRGSIDISEGFTDPEGVVLTPWLVYNNGKQVQQKQVSITYNDIDYNSFTVYFQRISDAVYAFMDENDEANYNPEFFTNDTIDDVYVNITTQNGVEITWGDTSIEEDGNRSAYDVLSDYLQVHLYDTHGKRIYTNVATYTLQEQVNNNYIIINNNRITSFASAEDATTYLSATASGIDGTGATTACVNFHIDSEGIREIFKDNSLYAGGNIQENGVAVDKEEWSRVQVEKYLTIDKNIILSNLIHVYVGDENDPTALTFRLNETYVAGLTTEQRNQLFRTGNNNQTAMLNLYSGAGFTDNDIADNLTTDLVGLKLNIPFSGDNFNIIFDVRDTNGLVNIQLELIILNNLEASPTFDAYEAEYVSPEGDSYLSSYGASDDVIMVFAVDDEHEIDLNTYLALNYIDAGDEENTLSWDEGGGNLIIYANEGSNPVGTAGQTDPITVDGSVITFNDVAKATIVSLRIYFKAVNSYTYSINLNFIVNPNYAFVRNGEYINIQDVDQNPINLLDRYELYRATDIISYIKGEMTWDNVIKFQQLPEGITLTYDDTDNSNQIISINNAYIARRQDATLNISLGGAEKVSIGFTFTSDDDNFSILMFDFENQEMTSFERTNAFTFDVGYGENNNAFSVIETLLPIDDNLSDYELRETAEGYLLVLLENAEYVVGNGWSASGKVVQPSTNGIRVGVLSDFNVQDTISFTNNGDVIRVNTLLTKIGLEYVKYEEDYDFDIITSTNPNDLVENNIYQEFNAGANYQIVFEENADYVDEEDDDYGFHYINSGTALRATLSVYSSTVSGLVSTSGNTITINSLVESEQEVFVILELNLRANVNAGYINHNIYYRIKVLPNYTLSDVSYPYSDNAEYLRAKDFTKNINEELVLTINFNEEFTSNNAQTSVIGEKRFADLYNMDGEVFEDANATYSISVSVNYGEPLTDYSQYLRLNCQNGSLEITLLDTSARIEITVVKSFNNVYNSSREYHIIINGSPEYEVYVDNTLNNLEHDITVGEEYSYTVSVMEKQDNSTETPITNLKGHVTSSNESLLVPFIIGGESQEVSTTVYSYVGPIINLDSPIFISVDTTQASKYIEVTSYRLFDDTNNQYDEEYYTIETTHGQFAVLANDLQFFDLSLNEDNATYTLYFKTVSSISSDDILTIGLYNDYENITDLVFNMDGGYNITYAEEMGGSYASGTSYTIRNFITSIFAHSNEEQDLTELFTYSLVDENEQRVILDDERNVTVAYSNEPFSVQFSATYSGYTFIFTVNFLASFNPNNVSTTVIDSTTHNSQDVISLSTVEDGLIKTKIAELFASSRDTIDTFTFASNNTDSFTISTVNVSENNTSYRQTITINYVFNGNVIFSFDLIYSYTVSPNVNMVMNYPNPENLTETDFTSEYITNDAEGTNVINNFFNTSTDFIAEVDGVKPNRVQVTSVGEGTYSYASSISISAINNVTISTGDGTFSSVGDVLGSSSSTASGGDSLTLPELNLTFTLNGSGASGSVTFAININSVIRYYSVIVTTTNSVTVETNAVDRVNSDEYLYAEDLTNQELNIFAKDRLLHYEFLTGASGTYVAKFVHDDGSTLYETLEVESGEVLVDLGRSYEGYQYAGTFENEVDARNNEDAYNDEEVFVTAPSLTSRIILRYAGREVSKDIASIYLTQGTETPTAMEEVSVTGDFFDTTTTYSIGYSLDLDGTIDNIIATRNQYGVYLTVKFEVNSDATSHYEELIAGNTYNLLEDFSASFEIMNPELDTYYAPSMFASAGSLELRIYGFSDMQILNQDNGGDALQVEAFNVHTALTNGTSSLAPGEVFETGLIPRYNMTINADTPETNIQSNYATIEEVPVGGTSDRTQDYEIYASGAGNNGNFIMMRLTYVVEFGGQRVSKSANLTFKIMPNLTVTFLSDNNTTNAQPGSTEEIDGATYLTNSARPYTISLSGSSLTQYLYTNSGNSILTVNLAGNSTNLAGTFDYTFPTLTDGSALTGGYNRYNDSQGLRLSWSGSASAGGFTFDGSATTSSISFTAYQISLGDRDYYFDAVDNHGFNIRIYVRISASLSPQIYDVTSSAREGDIIQIGVRHTEVNSRPITLTSTTSADESGLPPEDQIPDRYNGTQYNYRYTIGRDESTAPTFSINGRTDGIIAESLNSSNANVVYVYAGQDSGEGELFATQNFSLARSEAGAQIITMYVNTTAAGVGTDDLLQVYYTRDDGTEYLVPEQTTSSARPEFTDASGLQVILDGFNVYTYDDSGTLNGIPYSPDLASNFLNVQISSISFEYNGTPLTDLTINPGDDGYNSVYDGSESNRLIVGADKYIYDSALDVYSVPRSINTASESSYKHYTVPELPAYLYGTSNVVEDVVMVITLTYGTNSCEIRTTIDIERERTGEFNYNSVLDTTAVSSTSMFGSSNGIYNDTLEITLQSGATLEYAITTSSTTPADDSAYTQLPVNNNDYAVTYYARISEEFENLSLTTINSNRYVHIRSTQGDYTIKYGNDEVSIGEDGYGNLTLSSITNAPITLRINDIGELNNAGYVTREFYTIVCTGSIGNYKYYQQDNETNVYPIYTSVAGTDTTTAQYSVSNYYTVSSNDGTSTYYVIAPEQWASESLITLSSHANVESGFSANNQYTTIRNNATISGTPYKFTYEINGATIDAMGTITTSTSFGLNSGTITVKVYMKVSGEDGNFNSDRGKLIGTLSFTLGSSTLTGGFVSGPGIYQIGNSVVPIDSNYTLTGGSGNPVSEYGSGNSYTVQVDEEFVFSEKFGTESGHYNSHYTIVQEDENSNYLLRGNENSYTYTATGKYKSTFVESYVSGGISYRFFTATVVVYDENITTEIAVSAQKSDLKFSAIELFNQAGIVGVNEVYDCETGNELTATGINVNSAGLKTLSLAVVNETSVSHYTVNLLVYENDYDKDVAWTLRSRYNLSNIFGNNTVYKIENNELIEVSGEYLTTTPTEPISYYVVEGGTLNRYNITYHIHSSTQTDTSVIWFEKSETSISKENLLSALGYTETDITYTIYSVDSTTRKIEKIEIAYNIDDTENVFTREFLVNDGKSNYLRKVAFYRYTDKTEEGAIDVATVYDNNFIMANLNSIVRERLEITGGTISYFTYNEEAGALNQANNFNLLTQPAVDNVVTQDFYVLVNNEYYKFTVNFYCTRSRVSSNIIVKNSTSLTDLINDEVKGSLGIITGATSYEYYEITGSYLKSANPSSTVTMPTGDYSAKYMHYLCIVTDAEGNVINYILDIMFLYNNGGEVDITHLFSSSISTTTAGERVFNLSNVANTVANRLFETTMANISFYDSLDGETPITSITLQGDEQYYFATCFVQENAGAERTQIFLLIENNIAGGTA